MEGAQGAQRVLDDVPALHAQQRCDASGLERLAHLAGRPAQLQVARVTRDHPPRKVDLLELHPRVAGSDVAWNEHAPELTTNPAAAKAREVGLTRRSTPQVVGVEVVRGVLRPARYGLRGADLPGQVVVAVDQDRLAVDA